MVKPTGEAQRQPYSSSHVRVGDTVIESDGTEWLVHGIGRYVSANASGGHQPGLSVRPINGGRARVLSTRRFVHMARGGELPPRDTSAEPEHAASETRERIDHNDDDLRGLGEPDDEP